MMNYKVKVPDDRGMGIKQTGFYYSEHGKWLFNVQIWEWILSLPSSTQLWWELSTFLCCLIETNTEGNTPQRCECWVLSREQLNPLLWRALQRLPACCSYYFQELIEQNVSSTTSIKYSGFGLDMREDPGANVPWHLFHIAIELWNYVFINTILYLMHMNIRRFIPLSIYILMQIYCLCKSCYKDITFKIQNLCLWETWCCSCLKGIGEWQGTQTWNWPQIYNSTFHWPRNLKKM